MKNWFAKVTSALFVAFLLTFSVASCSDGNDDNSVEQSVESITLSAASTSAKIGETVEFSVSFAHFDTTPTTVDVYVEDVSTPIKTGVAVSGGKITLGTSDYDEGTYKLYVKSGNVQSNSVSVTLTLISHSVSANEAASTIESLASGRYAVKVTGAITAETIATIKTALLTDTTRYIALDLSGTTGLTELGENAFTRKDSSISYTGTPITSLILPASVTKIGEGCFYNCKQLASVTAPGVTVLERTAFYVCSALTEVTLADELESIGGLAFGYCSSLTELTLNAKTIGSNVVVGDKKLTKITFGAAVETITDGAIQDVATALKTIAVANGNTHFKVVDGLLYSADGTRLVRCPPAIETTEITLANTVTTIDTYVFAGCKNLTSVTLPNVAKIPSDAFWYCTALTTVSIPKATEIGGLAFYRCEKLASISLPDTLTSIGIYAFAYDTSLTTIFIPASVTTMKSDAFEYWTESQTINCAASSKPSGWNEKWSNYSSSTAAKATINWGATR